jgi:uncharacterized protein DUF1566
MTKKYIIKLSVIIVKPLKNFLTRRCALMFFIFAGLFYLILPATASKRFVDNGNGTITDNKTNLMWVSKDNGTPINWLDAIEYCKNLRVAGYADWRMPTLAELASLFNPSEKNKNGYHTIELISTTAQSCWASEIRGNSAGRFNYSYGKEYWLRKSYSGPTRALAVRNNQ